MSSEVASWMTSVRPYLRTDRLCLAAMRFWDMRAGYHKARTGKPGHPLSADFDETLRGDPGLVDLHGTARIVETAAVVESERLLLDR
jgi:hypothetical protein